MEQSRHIVMSLGGSLVVPDGIDVSFVRDFRSLISDYVSRGYTFTLIVGGGKICRTYQHALGELIDASRDTLDWMGIYTTHFNAELVRLAFGELAHDTVVKDPTMLPVVTKPVLIGGGWKPGWSTDYDAVIIARDRGAKQVINLSNISHVYDTDPRTNPEAKKFDKLSWHEYRSLIPSEWEAGLNAPFDPIASELAETAHIEVAIMNGKNLDNLRRYLDGVSFEGTIIQ